MSYQVLLYYIYTPLADPQAVVNWQRELCQRLGLTGPVIVAAEGINGTVEGLVASTEEYASAMLSDPQFASITFKRSAGTGGAFSKLSVKVRSEIVSGHFGEDDVDPNEVTGKRLSSEELHQWIHSGKDFAIIDMRNDYEHEVGRFKGSVLPPIRNFRELPDALPTLEHLKDTVVVTVCTGGVRCEKASGYLVQKGFSDVYQLQDGIVSYMEQYPGQDFDGALYVFDNRVTMDTVAADNRSVIGRCEFCSCPCERYINCCDDDCHRHFIACEACVADCQQTLCVKGIHKAVAIQK